MLLGVYEGVYADSNRLMPAAPAFSIGVMQNAWQVVKVYESKVWLPVIAPGNALGVPHALITPLRLILLTWAPVAVVTPSNAGGVVPRVLVMESSPVGRLKFRTLVPPVKFTVKAKSAVWPQG